MSTGRQMKYQMDADDYSIGVWTKVAAVFVLFFVAPLSLLAVVVSALRCAWEAAG